MLSHHVARAGLLVLLALPLSACTDHDETPIDDGGTLWPEAGTPYDAGVSPGIDAAADSAEPSTGDSGARVLEACLERPDRVARPSTSLPCELLPPGFTR